MEETNAARRALVVSGTVAQFNRAFYVTLQNYEHEVERSRRSGRQTETYRGHDGFIHVPADLVEIIVGVFGLDNRRITKRNLGDPPSTNAIPVTTVPTLYNFPTNLAAGQTIAIFTENGYLASDIAANFGGSPPSVVDISVDASNGNFADPETTQDIFIAGSAAPGAQIAVYFTTFDQKGWVDLITRVIHPSAGDPQCSVLSSSFYVSDGDDAATLLAEGVPTSWITAVTQMFEDAAIQGVTMCIASGDTGAQSKLSDGRAHVQYPGSDPWVLAVGGTTIGNVVGTSSDEWAWNDFFSFGGFSGTGASGGGVSDFFPQPGYQIDANVPLSVNDGHRGRGVPDVSANASPNSGYPIILGGAPSSFPVPIRFQPTAVGTFPATITVLSSDPAGPKHVQVSGAAPAGKLVVTGSTIFGAVPACCRVERTVSICNVGNCKLEVSSVTFKRKTGHWKLVNNPFPATLHPGSCLGVVIRYIATEKLPRSCDLVISSNDPTDPVKTLEVMATTVWGDCCAKCCEDCRKGCCQKQHCDSCRCRKCGGECGDEEDNGEE